MKRLLTKDGSIFVHCDWHASHYIKVELDKICGYSAFLNEIVWSYHSGGASRQYFGRKHDVLLWYRRWARQIFNDEEVRVPYTESTVKAFNKTDEEGRRYKLIRHRDGTEERVYAKNLERGRLLTDVWEDIPHIANWSKEKVGYPTQKPERLVERLIAAASGPSSIVADFFAGGGTTPAVAQRLGRRWIACDISRVAVSITADRVAKVVEEQQDDAKRAGTPVAILDFEVAHWGIYEIAGLSQMAASSFREFVLYEARVESTGSLIHGYKGKEPIHVGAADPDKPVRKEEVAEFANAVLGRLGSGGTGTMIAWAFTEPAKRLAERIAAQEKVKLHFVRLRLVPLESPEFAAHVTGKHERYADLVSFVLPPEIRVRRRKLGQRRYEFDASESIALNSGAKIINAQWDFDYRGYFTSSPGFELQRTKSGEPVLAAEYEFPAIGDFEIAVRVQDDLGGEAIRRDTVSVS